MNMVYTGNTEHYSTSDTQLAAFLQTDGFELLDIQHGQRSVFIFTNDNDKLQESIRLYHAGKARVEPSLYMRNYRSLVRKVREGLPA